MRTPNTGSVSYAPESPPSDLAGLVRFVQEREIRLSAAITALAAGQLDPTHVAPAKPRPGMVRLADGVNWNPGGLGAGVYCYYNAAWNKLG